MFDSIDATTVVFLALAVFVVLRLRSVLGQRPQLEHRFGRAANERIGSADALTRRVGACHDPLQATLGTQAVTAHAALHAICPGR